MRGRGWGTVVLLGSLTLVACSDDDQPPSLDGGAGDAGPPGDATSFDAVVSGLDAQPQADAGPQADALPGADALPMGADAATIVDPCNPVTQTGCTTAPMTKCAIQGSGPTQCVEPNMNDAMRDQPCGMVACGPGLVCLRGTGSSTISTCRQLCDLNAGTGCAALNMGGMEYECRTRVTGTNWGICSLLPSACTTPPDSCPQNLGCQPYRRGQMFDLRCQPVGTATEGQSCTGPGDCAKGLFCINVMSMGMTGPRCVKPCTMNGDCTSNNCGGTVTGLADLKFCTLQ